MESTGIYSDGSSVDVTSRATWSSDDTSVATVSSEGVVSAIATSGSANITASFGGISTSAPVTVAVAELQSITVTPDSGVIPQGLTKQFAATGHYSDGSSVDISSSVTWSTSSTSIATVNNAGLASSVSPGLAVITATIGSISGEATLSVGGVALYTLNITPADPAIPKGCRNNLPPPEFIPMGLPRM